MSFVIKSLTDACPKKFHEIQNLGMRQGLYKYYRQCTVDLRKNDEFENRIDELIVVRTFQNI